MTWTQPTRSPGEPPMASTCTPGSLMGPGGCLRGNQQACEVLWPRYYQAGVT